MRKAQLLPPFRAVCAEMLSRSRGIAVRFTATGRSMRPTIRDGEILLVEPISGERICPGQVLLAAGPSGVRAHRVVRGGCAASGVVVMRGDALPDCDAPAPFEFVLGRVTSVWRSGRYVPVDGWRVVAKVALFRLMRVTWLFLGRLNDRLLLGIGHPRRGGCNATLSENRPRGVATASVLGKRQGTLEVRS